MKQLQKIPLSGMFYGMMGRDWCNVISFRTRHLLAIALCAASAGISIGCVNVEHNGEIQAETQPISAALRELVMPPAAPGQGWGVCYGPFRDGQGPDTTNQPSKVQIREDLHIIAKHWRMVRMYGQGDLARYAAEVIREDKLPVKLLAGIWIAAEVQLNDKGDVIARDESLVTKNRLEVEQGIKLANDFPDVVMALGVGNETQVSWSGYRTTPDVLLGYVKQVRAAVKQPVTTCDDYNFWNKPESAKIAQQCDFIALHAYAMWNKQHLPDALSWTREQIDAVKALHPDRSIVLTELGWATQKGTEGYQAIGIVGEAGEKQQELFYRALEHWANDANQPYFYFSAFDEKWKGGGASNEVEKNWGVFNSDRTPKLVMQEGGKRAATPASK